MCEAFGVAASVLGVVGFAGQILQGCQNVVSFLDQIQDAPKDFQYFRTEVRIFQSILESYRTTLNEIESSSDRDVWEQSRLVLDYSDEAVAGLQKLINKHERVMPKWKSIGLAFQSATLEKHLRRIDRAKGSLIAAQTNGTLSVQPFNASAWHLLTDNSLQGYRLSGLVQDANARLSRMNSKVCASEKTLSAILYQFQDLRVSSQETRNAVEDLSDMISSKVDYLPIGFRHMVENTVRRVLLDFYGGSLSPPSKGTAASCPLAESPYSHSIRSDRKLSSSGDGVSKQIVLRRNSNQRTFQTWFGVVSVHSTSSKLMETTSAGNIEPFPKVTTKSTRTTVTVSFSPCFIGFGIYCTVVRQAMGSAKPGLDMKMRLYNVVRKTSSIIQACEEGNIGKMQTLFATGQASPFDRLDGNMSLLDLVLLKMTALPMRKEPSKSLRAMKNFCQMFSILVELGLDPGQLWTYSKSNMAPLQYLTAFSYYASPESTPFLLDIARNIIQHSVQDPYNQADFTEVLRFQKYILGNRRSPIATLVMNPEHWDVNMRFTDRVYQSSKLQDKNPCFNTFFRAWLDNSVDPNEAVETLTSIHFKVRDIVCNSTVKGVAEAHDQHAYKHVIACLEAGIDPLLESGGYSLVSCLRQSDQLHVLRSALEHLKWTKDQIYDLFEVDLFASLAYQLAHLHIKAPQSLEGEGTMQFRHIRPKDWDAYAGKLPGDVHLSSIVHIPLSNPDNLDSSAEAARGERLKDSSEVAKHPPISIGSIVQTSMKLGKNVLGCIV
jgi:hypothetical protein